MFSLLTLSGATTYAQSTHLIAHGLRVTDGFVSVPEASAQNEKQTDSSRFRTQFPGSIFTDDNHYAICTSRYNTFSLIMLTHNKGRYLWHSNRSLTFLLITQTLFFFLVTYSSWATVKQNVVLHESRKGLLNSRTRKKCTNTCWTFMEKNFLCEYR